MKNFEVMFRGSNRERVMVFVRIVLVFCAVSIVAVNQAATAAEEAGPGAETYKLIKESWAIGEAVKAGIWPGWEDVAPEILLMENDREYLIGPRPLPEGFELIGPAEREDWTIASRARVFDPRLLATFPAFGPPATIIVGTPETTGREPDDWVITLLHENFHQFQYGLPGYYAGTDALGLAKDGDGGMWMITYPFPYAETAVNDAFDVMTAALLAALDAPEGERSKAACGYYAKKQALRGLVSEKDYRYLGFQLWQEGMAEYTAYRAARAAGTSFGKAYQELADRMREDARMAIGEKGVLEKSERVVFYRIGHLEAALLDAIGADWQSKYLLDKFQTDSFFPCAG